MNPLPWQHEGIGFLNECEKLRKINEIFGHSLNVKDFVQKLNLCNFGIDPHHDIDLDFFPLNTLLRFLEVGMQMVSK